MRLIIHNTQSTNNIRSLLDSEDKLNVRDIVLKIHEENYLPILYLHMNNYIWLYQRFNQKTNS